jgi:hypothetical protein
MLKRGCTSLFAVIINPPINPSADAAGSRGRGDSCAPVFDPRGVFWVMYLARLSQCCFK